MSESETKYLFDTNIFIQGKNVLPADVWPTFWNRLDGLIHDGKIFSIINVKKEIEQGNDELVDWFKQHVPSNSVFWLPIDTSALSMYAKLMSWATSQKFTQEVINSFAKCADSYLVATAAARGYTLVSYEKSNPACKKRVMIPDACIGLHVRCCDLNTAFREMKVKV